MNCEEVMAQMAEFVTQDLNPAAMLKLQAHVVHCGPCAHELELITQTWDNLARLPECEPGERLRHNFYQMLQAYEEGMTPTEHPKKVAWWSPLWLQAAAALILLSLGFWLGSGPKQQELAEQNPEPALRQDRDHFAQLASLSLMKADSAGERLSGIYTSNEVTEPDQQVTQTMLQLLNNDPHTGVRLAAVDALYKHRHKGEVRAGLVRALDAQSHPLVQLALIDVLVDLGEAQASDPLKRLLENPTVNPNVAALARRGLRSLH